MGPGASDIARHALAGHVEVAEEAGSLTPWRLPAQQRRYAPAALALMAEFTSGIRMRLRSRADRIELDGSIIRLAMRHIGYPEAPARFVLVDGDTEVVAEIDETGVVVETADRLFERGVDVRSRVSFDLPSAGIERDVVLWLPHDAGVTVHELTATLGGVPTPISATPATTALRWVHHGSSISHGGSASLPTRTWPALAARALGVDAVNLGFGGNAMLDPMTARAIAGTAADVVTVKIGINIVGADAMRRRTFVPALHGFLDLVRAGHPDTPIVVISALGCAALETDPGPLRPGSDGRIAATPREVSPGDGTLTLQVTRDLIAQVVALRSADDPALHHLDGTRLLAPDEGGLLPDGLHPGDEGYALIAARFAALASDPAEPLGASFAAARRTAGERLETN